MTPRRGREPVTLRVVINGTDVNPWHRYGLTQNPFPQVGTSELAGHLRALDSLGGDPVRSAARVREVLKGWDEDFVELVVARYLPGETVTFEVVVGCDDHGRTIDPTEMDRHLATRGLTTWEPRGRR